MADDNVVRFPPRSSFLVSLPEAMGVEPPSQAEILPADVEPQAVFYDSAGLLPTNAILPEQLQQSDIACLGFDDINAAFNMRAWLQQAVEAAGAKMTAGGFGGGVADLWVELEGHTYEITIRPVLVVPR